MKMMKTLWVSMLSVGLLCGCAKTPTYKISWWNGEELLASTQVKQNEMPAYDGAAPTKTDADGEFEYKFTGWTPEVVAATQDASYDAEFEETRVNWSKEEREAQEELLGELIPFFEVPQTDGAYAKWEFDEDHSCFSVKTTASVEDVAAAFVKGGYTEMVFDDSDPEEKIDELVKVVGEDSYIDVDVYDQAELCCVDVYVPAELPTKLSLIEEIATGMFKDPTAYQDDEEGGYWTGGIYGASGFNNNLELFAKTLAFYMMPSGVYVIQSRATTLTSGADAYVVLGVTINRIVVELLAYASGESFIGQFSVYDMPTE